MFTFLMIEYPRDNYHIYHYCATSMPIQISREKGQSVGVWSSVLVHPQQLSHNRFALSHNKFPVDGGALAAARV